MSLWRIAWRSIQRRWLASLLTAISMGLGVALVVGVLLVIGVVRESFRNNSSLGYNVIVGAPSGGSLQLVLNAVYYVAKPIGNIDYETYRQFLSAKERGDGRDGKYKPYVDFAIPVCLGDYYEGYRVIGTTTQLFDDFEYDPEKHRKFQFAQGRNFRYRDPQNGFFEAVLGAAVARSTGTKIGDRISPAHGEATGRQHEDGFVVVGILRPSGTPVDRGVFVNMEGFLLLDGHAKPVPPPETADGAGAPVAAATPTNAHEHDDPDPAAMEPLPLEQREVTALLVRTSGLLLAQPLINKIRDEKRAQAVLPVREIYGLFAFFVEPIQQLLLIITALICVVSGIGILVSIYNSMSDRRQEIAVMRALGAGRTTVLWVVLFESILLSVGGGLLGWLAGHLLVAVASPEIEARTGVQLGWFELAPQEKITLFAPVEIGISPELLIIPSLILLAILVGILPALAAYRTDVARALSANP